MEEGERIDNTGYYAVLSLAQDASEEDIKRSYRKLAQTFHPDKAQDASHPQSDPNASTNFMRIQEAYEVLSDEGKRRIYDVYGLKGLQSGLEVGPYLRNPEEVYREYERLKALEKKQRKEASVAHRGHYIFKIDACDCVPVDGHVLEYVPELTSMATRNSVQLPLSDSTAASIGCQVAVRKNQGGGSFVCGVRRVVTKDDTIELQASIGLKQFAHVEVRRQMGVNTTASVATSYHPHAGMGFVLATSRTLTDTLDADLTYQVGPESVMSFGLTRRGEKTYTSGRIEVGVSTGIVFKAVWQATASMSLRLSAKLGTMGIELELGASQKLTEFSSAGCSVVAGLQGVVLRPKFSRGGHVFEVPILLSTTVSDYRVAAAAYILPPAISLMVKFWIVKPLRRRAKLQKALSQRADKIRDVEAAVSIAKRASTSLQPLAMRKLRAEAAKDGLIVLNAKYGTPEAINQAEAQEREEPTGNEVRQDASQDPSSTQQQGNDSDSDNEFAAEIQKAIADSQPALPGNWLDVTNAIRYLVAHGQITLHQGYSKSGLMGFADVAVDEEKVLVIHFLYQKHPYSVTVSDQGGIVIPGSKDHLIDQRDNDAFKLFRKFIAREKLGNVIYGQQRGSDPSLTACSETSGQ